MSRKALSAFLARLQPALMLETTRISAETVPLESLPLWYRRLQANEIQPLPIDKVRCWSYCLSFGEKQIEGFFFGGPSTDRLDVADIITGLLIDTHDIEKDDEDYDEEMVQSQWTRLHTLFTEGQITALYETEY